MRGRLIKRSRSSRAGPGTNAPFIGMHSDIRVKILGRLVVLGSYRPKRADTGPDAALRIRSRVNFESENGDLRRRYAVWRRRRIGRWESRKLAARRLA